MPSKERCLWQTHQSYCPLHSFPLLSIYPRISIAKTQKSDKANYLNHLYTINISFLLVALSVSVYHIHKWLKAHIRHLHISKLSILLVVNGRVASAQPLVYVRRYEKRRPLAQVSVELGKIDVYASQVEIAKMNITITPVRDKK